MFIVFFPVMNTNERYLVDAEIHVYFKIQVNACASFILHWLSIKSALHSGSFQEQGARGFFITIITIRPC